VGADDYLAKPYDLGELVLRIHAVTQRNALQDRIQWRNLTFDFTRGEVMRDGEHIHLSATQLLILQEASSSIKYDDQMHFGEMIINLMCISRH
jgi:DNA-binding response OmpR family regulator